MAWRLFRRVLVRRAEPLEFVGPVLVLAPHPDDESLGAGGLVALARSRGIEVEIVVATDGSASHPGVDTVALARRRRDELRAAVALLGVPPERLVELGLPDGRLSEHRAELEAALVARGRRWGLVVGPFGIDANPDHRTLSEVARSVFADAPSMVEYPVWAYHRWAWMDVRSSRPRRLLQLVVRPALAAVTLDVVTLDVAPVLERQRAALAAHVSQVEGRIGDRTGDRLGQDIIDLTVNPTALFVRVR